MAEITWKSILTKLVGGDHLTAEESEWFVDDLMQGNANPAAVGAALAMQQQLGLTADEVRGAAKAMVSHAVPLNVSGGTTDIVGTGGDGFATVNLSTMGSVAAAAAGVKIVKHGNRAASSKCGAADVLEDLGLPLDLKPEATRWASPSRSPAPSTRPCASWARFVPRSAFRASSTSWDR